MTGSDVGAADAGPAWHGLTPAEALERQGVTVADGLATAEVETRRARYGPNKFADAAKEPRWQAFLRQYKDPMQIVLLAAGILSLFLPNQVATGVVLIALTLLNAAMGLSQEGKAVGQRRRAPEDDGRQGQGPPRRGPRRGPDGRARAGRHRQHRGRRPRPGGRPDPHAPPPSRSTSRR